MNKEQRITAIEKSIKHWEDDILNPLKEGRNIISIDKKPYWEDTKKLVPCYRKDCPLCKIYFTGLSTCYDCPLESCSNDSTWMKFRDNPNLKNAQEVVYELKGTLIMEDMKDE
jgi:hypothetical protein